MAQGAHHEMKLADAPEQVHKVCWDSVSARERKGGMEGERRERESREGKGSRWGREGKREGKMNRKSRGTQTKRKTSKET